MMRAPRNFGQALFVAALLGSTTLWTGCRGQLSENPPVHLNPNMDQQMRLDPQEPHPFVQNQRGMQGLVAGTVARPLRISKKSRDSRFLQADDHFYRGYKIVSVKSIVDGSMTQEKSFFKTLPKSLSLNAKLLAYGQERFNIYCAPCHGFTGNGQGVVTLYERGFMPRNLHSDRVRGMSVGEIYNTITNGVGKMLSLRSAIPPRDRWAIVAYVRALQLSRISPSSR